MTNIRVPEEARLLLPYVATNQQSEQESVFDSYAHMVVFCACLGFELKEFREKPSALTKGATPIELAIVMHGDKLLQAALLLGLARDRTDRYVTDEDRLCRIIEGYAAAGAAFLVREFELCGWKEVPSTLHSIVKRLAQRGSSGSIEQVREPSEEGASRT